MLKLVVVTLLSAVTTLVALMMEMLRPTRRASADDSALDSTSRLDTLVFLTFASRSFLALTARRALC